MMTVLLMATLSMGAQEDEVEMRGRIENVTEYAPLSSDGRVRKIGSTATAPLTCMGSPKVPVILVQFDDMSFKVGEDDEAINQAYQDFFNAGEGVTPGASSSSIKEYFRLQSNSQFSPEFDIIGPVRLSKSYTYYGEDSGSSKDIHFRDFFKEACQLAAQQEVDWQRYDNDGNGVVDFVFFIYAGVGQNQTGAEPSTIWPKESASTYVVENDEGSIHFGALGCANELYRGQQDGIGSCVHEMCHGLGLPDFYDYNYKEYGMDFWDVMDAGCYKLLGHFPVGLSAYELDFLGWRKLVELDPETAYSLTIDPLEKEGVGYKVVNKANPDEYFILENRQDLRQDTYIGYATSSHYKTYGANHGLMITHVNFKQSLWNSNTVNTQSADNQHFTIVPADGELIPSHEDTSSAWAKSQHGDLYPGENNVTEMTSYAVFTGGTLGQTIDNIVEHEDSTITVDINGGAKVKPQPEPEPEPEQEPEPIPDPLFEPDIPEIA